MDAMLATMSRRRFLVLTTVTGLLGACSSDGTATETTARSTMRQRGRPDSAATTAAAPSITTVDESPSSIAQASGRAEGFPRTVGRDFATATIAAPPARIVATADRDQLDVLLAMGVEPVLYGRSGDYEQAAPWIDPAAVDDLETVDMPGTREDR